MSRATITEITSGSTSQRANANATLLSVDTATGDVGDVNVRDEGIDRINIVRTAASRHANVANFDGGDTVQSHDTYAQVVISGNVELTITPWDSATEDCVIWCTAEVSTNTASGDQGEVRLILLYDKNGGGYSSPTTEVSGTQREFKFSQANMSEQGNYGVCTKFGDTSMTTGDTMDIGLFAKRVAGSGTETYSVHRVTIMAKTYRR
jgi:hypothetical protein